MSTGFATGGVGTRTGVRGIAVAAATVAALTGCGDGEGTDPVTGAVGGSGASRPTTPDATGPVDAFPCRPASATARSPAATPTPDRAAYPWTPPESRPRDGAVTGPRAH